MEKERLAIETKLEAAVRGTRRNQIKASGKDSEKVSFEIGVGVKDMECEVGVMVEIRDRRIGYQCRCDNLNVS